MPTVTLLDLVLIAVMLISGLLAMVRGFMREILSIAAWAAAAGATLYTFYAFPRVVLAAQDWLKNDILAKVAVAAGVFIGTLIVVSIFTVRISDMVLDSRIGALDRTLGFLFGLARGFLIVVVAFQFFMFWVSEKQRPDAVTFAKSRLALQASGEWLISVLPENLAEMIAKKMVKNKPEDERSDEPGAPAAEGYAKPDRDNLKKLIEKPAGR
jgi:membrane protein required for colicin V production